MMTAAPAAGRPNCHKPPHGPAALHGAVGHSPAGTRNVYVVLSSCRLAPAPARRLLHAPASAIGLGEIRLHSALAEPLTADIELIDARGLGADDIKVRLAPSDVFARAGVERPDFSPS